MKNTDANTPKKKVQDSLDESGTNYHDKPDPIEPTAKSGSRCPEETDPPRPVEKPIEDDFLRK